MKVDLHVHTFFSDGKESPETLVEYARKKGIYIAITDHDVSRGVERVKGKAIPGQEVTTQYGHVVILCSFPPSPPREISELVDYARENSCVVFPSHPFDLFRKGIGDHVYEYKFNAIEVFNSKAPRRANSKAEEASQRLHLLGLANSDSHVKEAIGSAYNEVEVEEFNVDEVLEALLRGRSKPMGIGLSVNAKIKIAEWYIQRKLFEKNTRRALREV